MRTHLTRIVGSLGASIVLGGAGCGAPSTSTARETTQTTRDALIGGVADSNITPAILIDESCTGAPLGGPYVITAAHCVYQLGGMGDSGLLTYTPGVHVEFKRPLPSDPSKFETQTRKIVQAIPSPDYALCQQLTPGKCGVNAPGNPSDVALLVVNAPLPASWPVAIVDATPLYPGEQVVITGYGCETPGGQPVPRHKYAYEIIDDPATMNQHAIVDVIDDVPHFSTNFVVTPSQAEGGDGSICEGDSGGPVFRGSTGTNELVAVNQGFLADSSGTPRVNIHARIVNDTVSKWLASLLFQDTGARPDVPRNVSFASFGPYGVQIAWAKPTPDVKRIHLSRTDGREVDIAAGASSFVDDEVTMGASYTYRLCFGNAAGDSCLDYAWTQGAPKPAPMPGPSAPTNVACDSSNHPFGSCTLRWQETADVLVTTYTVERRSAGQASWSQVAVDLPPSARSFEATYPLGATNQWRVCARGLAGDACTTTHPGGASPPVNFLADASFEQQRSEQVLGLPWRGEGGGSQRTELAVDGAHSGVIDGVLSAASGWNALTQRIAVTPQTTYRAVAWLKTASSVKDLYFGVRHPDGTVSAEKKVGPFPSWTQVSVPFDTAGDAAVTVYAGYWAADAESWVRVDDIAIAPDTASAQHLPPAGSEGCDTLSGGAFDALLGQLTIAKAALGVVPPTPGVDVAGAIAKVEKAASGMGSTSTWMTTKHYNASNPSVASNVIQSTDVGLYSLFAASKVAVAAAQATPSPDASAAVAALVKAERLAHDLGAAGGRCGMDVYAGRGDWRAGVAPNAVAAPPLPPPTTCAGLDARALDPLAALLSMARDYEQAELSAHPGDPGVTYGQRDLDSLVDALRRVAALRAWMGARSVGAEDAATAAYAHGALLDVLEDVVYGREQAFDTQVRLPGPTRYDYEAELAAGDYLLQLTELAAACADPLHDGR